LRFLATLVAVHPDRLLRRAVYAECEVVDENNQNGLALASGQSALSRLRHKEVCVSLLVLLFGIGMFCMGWIAHAFIVILKPVREYVEPTARFECPECRAQKDLPLSLHRKVLICNRCQVKMTKRGGEQPRNH
jgi:hypothetical protein